MPMGSFEFFSWNLTFFQSYYRRIGLNAEKMIEILTEVCNLISCFSKKTMLKDLKELSAGFLLIFIFSCLISLGITVAILLIPAALLLLMLYGAGVLMALFYDKLIVWLAMMKRKLAAVVQPAKISKPIQQLRIMHVFKQRRHAA